MTKNSRVQEVNLKYADNCMYRRYNEQWYLCVLKGSWYYDKSLWTKVRVYGCCGGKRMVGLGDECRC